MSFCYKCGTEIGVGESFCSKCGTMVQFSENETTSRNNYPGQSGMSFGKQPQQSKKVDLGCISGILGISTLVLVPFSFLFGNFVPYELVNIFGFIFGLTACVGFFAGLAAFVLGIIGIRKTKNKGLTITGIVVGSICILALIFIILGGIYEAGQQEGQQEYDETHLDDEDIYEWFGE